MVDLKQEPGARMKDALQSEVIDGTDMALEAMLQAVYIAAQFNLSMEEIMLEAEDMRKHPKRYQQHFQPAGDGDEASDLRECARHSVAIVCSQLMQYCFDFQLPFSDVLRYAVRTYKRESAAR